MTGGAASEDPYFTSVVQFFEPIAGNFAYVFVDEFGGVVEFEGMSAGLFDIDASDNIDALPLQAMGEPPGTTKEVNARHVFHLSSISLGSYGLKL